VLARHAGLSLGQSDVFVSVTGGVRVEEPGADLAVALALASAARGAPLSGPGAGAPADGRPLAAFGEVGLTGELRHVAHPERRVAEAEKFGLAPVLSPEGSAGTLRAAIAAALPRARPAAAA
jgi:DNA repair protein RadA/Sms